jgi:N-acetylglucosaminyl-diphospho-decaprenol L-rhamnosyltransferase
MKYTIVVPVMNQLHYTKECLSDLFSTTEKNTEIIIVNNASTDGTEEFLTKAKRVRVVSNDDNKGCAASWNQGIEQSNGDWIVFLNNDVRLPQGWLDNLISTAIEKKVNIISPGMREGELNYKFENYSLEYTNSMQNVFRKWTPSGVCFLVRKNVFDKVGLFDENFNIGQYEDADFFRRCKNFKLNMGITGRSFIHHFGSVTQKSIQKKTKSDYSKRNKNYHRKKWGIGLIRRHFERYREQLLIKYWSKKEYFLYKHSLLEKHDGVKLYYH